MISGLRQMLVEGTASELEDTGRLPSESERKVEALVKLLKDLRARVQKAGKRGVSEQLAADLVGQPYVTVPMVARLYGVSDQGAAKAIKALVGLEIIQPIKLRAPHGAQMYGARDVLTILNS
jgi:Fic family protein